MVVSEYHPNVFRDLRVGDTVTVDLVPEPSNAFDRHAVAVLIRSETVGYLNIGAAEKYQALIQQASRLGYRVQARGKYEHGAASATILLRLPRPDDLQMWLELPDDRRARGYQTPELRV